MARKAKKAATKVPKGIRFTKGSGWTMTATKGARRSFRGTCLGTINIGAARVVMFRAPK